MHTARELGRFLASRRARLQPGDVDLPTGARRRVPGLRREEVAQLAGVSVEYYTRLEQGRTGTPSRAVLTALATSLRLDAAERRHLADLTGHSLDPAPTPMATIRPALSQLLTQMHDVPAMVINHRFDVLAWNRLAALVLMPFDDVDDTRRNLARYLFCDVEARRRYVDWDELAHVTAAQLRMAIAGHPDDARLKHLVEQLRTDAPEFAGYWDSHDVHERTHGIKRLWHPDVGHLTLAFENFLIPGTDEQRLVTFHAPPGSPEADKLTLLGIGDRGSHPAPQT